MAIVVYQTSDWGEGPVREFVATGSDDDREFWLKGRSVQYEVEDLPEATEAEAEKIEELKSWLVANYEKGAHWIYETTDTADYLVKLREAKSLAALKAAYKREWTIVEEHAEEIRNA